MKKKITEFSKLESFYREWCSNQSIFTENEAIYRFLDSSYGTIQQGIILYPSSTEARRIYRYVFPSYWTPQNFP